MNITMYNKKNQNTEVCQYLKEALGRFALEVCLGNNTFFTRLREAVAEKAAIILSKPNFYGLKAREEMDDLIQDLFYHILENLVEVDLNSNFGGWLYTTSRNYLIDRSKALHAIAVEADSFILLNVCVEEDFSQISMARDYQNTLDGHARYNKDLKSRLLIGEPTAKLSAEFGIPESTLKRVKGNLKRQMKEWVKKNGF